MSVALRSLMRVWIGVLVGMALGMSAASYRWLGMCSQPVSVASAPTAHPAAPVPSSAPNRGPRHESNQRKQTNSPATPSAPRTATPLLSENLNVLLVGLDRRPGVRAGGRPDTIILASFSERQAHVGLVSIPRDLYVNIPEHGDDRINATFGVAWQLKQKPSELLRRVVVDTLGVPIAHTVVIDLQGFETAIDAVGGVEVHVPCAISDNFIDARLKQERRRLEVDAGYQHMDGKTAAMYVRSRHGRSDWSRARRQQAVLLALKRKVLSPSSVPRLPALLKTVGESIHTDLSRVEMLKLAARLVQVEAEHIHGTVIGYRETRAHRTPDGKSVLLPEPHRIREKLGKLFAAEAPGTLPTGAQCADKDVALRHKGQQPVPPTQGQAGAPATADAELGPEAVDAS